jgi:predicted outer membrane repeat protein
LCQPHLLSHATLREEMMNMPISICIEAVTRLFLYFLDYYPGRTSIGIFGGNMKSLATRHWIRSLIQSWFSRTATLTRNARTRYRLQVEALEERVTPSNWLVTNTSNSSSTSGSLPWAVAHADTDTSDADITFSATAFPNAATITLNATLTLSNTAHSITIDGGTAGPITVSGGGTVEDFNVNTNVNAGISNLTIANGHAGFNGGGIANAGGLTLTNDVLIDNLAGYEGGGLYNTGTATLANITLSNNSMQGNGGGFGGGIFSSGSISVADSVFIANSSSYSGSAISGAGTMVVTNSTFADNVASFGALEVHDVTATVIGCTFTGNTSSNGGAVWMSSFNGPATALTLVDCTLSGNATQNNGGAIAANNIANLSLNLVHCTIVGNSAHGGGGVWIGNANTPTTLVNTIVAGNTVGGSPSDIIGVIGGSNNLIGTGVGMTGITNGTNGNQVGTAASPINPLLNALTNNGGPTQTVSELTGSPALGSGGVVTTISANVINTTITTITVANLSRLAVSPLPGALFGLLLHHSD